MGRWGRDEYVHQKEFSMQWNYSEVSIITQLKTMNGLMEEIPVAQQEHPPWTIQWMKNIQTSIVWTHCVFGSACHRSLCYLNTGSIFRQRWIETYPGNILGVNWNPKWWLDWGGIKELRFPQWGTITRQSGWLLSKSLQAINAGEDVEKREPSYTVGGNAN